MSKVDLSGIDYIDTLLMTGRKWGTGGVRQSANITYGFRSTFTDEQKEQLRTGLDAWEEIANIEFEAVKDSKDPGQIRFDWINDGAQARPDWSDNGIKSVEVDIGRGSPYKQKGSFGYSLILLHEIGHALGLKHPHESNDGSVADLAIDTTAYSVMSYRSYKGQSIDPQSYTQDFFPTTPMLHDIAAIQYLYGANMNTRKGDTVYWWNPDQQILETIWDAGGVDTIDWSNQSSDAKIDLREAKWSELGPAYNNGKTSEKKTLAIAYDVIIENANGGSGNDTITGNQVANQLKGNKGDDSLEGGAGNDTLDGGLGNDSMSGGEGDDSYYVDNSFDTITESNFQGNDIVYSSSISYTLSDNLENLNLIEGSDAINATGNKLNNIITGNSSNNSLDGLEGIDTLIGGSGNDSYYIDNISDTITEFSGEGNDTVYSSITYKLGENLENLTLNGNDEIDGIGNNFKNIIIGNNSNNYLEGIAGDDTLIGGDGNDKLIGGKDADILDGGEGNDTASYSTATDGVTANLTNTQENTGDAQGDVFQSIENLEGSEFGDRLFGDVQNNDIQGLGGDDYLDGLTGDDTMSGGTGNDTYKIENVNDVVIENIDEGIDTVDATIDYALGANLENLNLLEDTSALNGTGNELNNIINGNSGDNVIFGGDGDDSITGGLGRESSVPGSLGKINGTPGSDILTGGNGNDAFIYNNIADSGDLITDFTVGNDKIVVTDLLQSLGYAGSDPITDGFLGFKQASDSLAVLQIDPDGAASDMFNPMPFILLDNVSVAALNDSSNFVF